MKSEGEAEGLVVMRRQFRLDATFAEERETVLVAEAAGVDRHGASSEGVTSRCGSDVVGRMGTVGAPASLSPVHA